MSTGKINDRQLLRLVDAGQSQAQAARALGVSRQAVNKRLQELRGRQTKVLAAKKIEEAVNANFDAMRQLTDINQKTLVLLDEAEKNPELILKCVGEIRNQIKLASDIYQTMYSVQVVNQFMQTVADVLKETDADVYREFKSRINTHRSVRGVIRIA
jgi:predicted transcriptional regulator